MGAWRAGDGRVAGGRWARGGSAMGAWRIGDGRVADRRWALLASPVLDRTTANSAANSAVDRVTR
jgi:hypothetical protein